MAFELILCVVNGAALASLWFMYQNLKGKTEAAQSKKDELERTLATLNSVHNSMAMEVGKIHDKISAHDLMLSGMKSTKATYVSPFSKGTSNGNT